MSRTLDRLLRSYVAAPPGFPPVDFSAPQGAPALFAPDSVTWRVMKNPVALMVGGVAAVILELAEPRVRTGVWEHTSFRRDPVMRIRRTGYAAWVTIYAPAEAARAMIAGVTRAHDRVAGATPAGAAYQANEQELLDWVQATASYGFVEAYRRFVRPLSAAEIDRFYAESQSGAELYGALGAPRSAAQLEALFAAMAPKLKRSAIVFEFLDIMRAAPLLPSRALQNLVIRAAVEITPTWARDTLGLDQRYRLPPSGVALLKPVGAVADKVMLESAPPAQACVRLGLPPDHLYR